MKSLFLKGNEPWNSCRSRTLQRPPFLCDTNVCTDLYLFEIPSQTPTVQHKNGLTPKYIVHLTWIRMRPSLSHRDKRARISWHGSLQRPATFPEQIISSEYMKAQTSSLVSAIGGITARGLKATRQLARPMKNG